MCFSGVGKMLAFSNTMEELITLIFFSQPLRYA